MTRYSARKCVNMAKQQSFSSLIQLLAVLTTKVNSQDRRRNCKILVAWANRICMNYLRGKLETSIMMMNWNSNTNRLRRKLWTFQSYFKENMWVTNQRIEEINNQEILKKQTKYNLFGKITMKIYSIVRQMIFTTHWTWPILMVEKQRFPLKR